MALLSSSLFFLISREPSIGFLNRFFSWKLRSIHKFWIPNHICAILGGQDIHNTNYGSETDQLIFILSHIDLKTEKFVTSSTNWSKTVLIAPKWLLVRLVTQTDWINVITVFILIIFKMCGSSKSNNLSFDQNHLIKNLIFFANISAPKNRTEMIVYSKFAYGSQFSGENNYFKIRYLVTKILKTST